MFKIRCNVLQCENVGVRNITADVYMFELREGLVLLRQQQ